VAVATGLALVVLPAAAATAQDSGPTIAAEDEDFNPVELHVTPGTTITWTNTGAENHTVTSDDGTTFDSGTLAPGDPFTFTFTDPGAYPYYCTIHGGPGGQGMAGLIIVAPQ